MAEVTRWAVIDTHAQPIRDEGEVIFGFTLRCLETGHEYIVTVSGQGESLGAEFAAALQAAALHIASTVTPANPETNLARH